jgi:hypothetical protein
MSTLPDPTDNICGGLSADQRARLEEAASILVGARGLMIRIVDFVGASLSQLGTRAAGIALQTLGTQVETKIQGIVHEALWRAYGAATAGLNPNGGREPWDWLNKAVVSASGAASGFLGLPGLAFDLPLTTGMIIRSLAEIARSHGEDDGAEIGYWSTRAALSQLAIQNLLNQAAKQFGLALTQKVSAQLVPAIGAVAGGGLNFIFMDYYQQMARVHFAIRALERETGDESAVRACFDAQVTMKRRQRRLSK